MPGLCCSFGSDRPCCPSLVRAASCVYPCVPACAADRATSGVQKHPGGSRGKVLISTGFSLLLRALTQQYLWWLRMGSMGWVPPAAVGWGCTGRPPLPFTHISPLPTSTLTPWQTTPQRHSVDARPPGYRGKPSRGLSFPCPWTSIFFPFVPSLEGSPSRRPRPPVVSRAPGS